MGSCLSTHSDSTVASKSNVLQEAALQKKVGDPTSSSIAANSSETPKTSGFSKTGLQTSNLASTNASTKQSQKQHTHEDTERSSNAEASTNEYGSDEVHKLKTEKSSEKANSTSPKRVPLSRAKPGYSSGGSSDSFEENRDSLPSDQHLSEWKSELSTCGDLTKAVVKIEVRKAGYWLNLPQVFKPCTFLTIMITFAQDEFWTSHRRGIQWCARWKSLGDWCSRCRPTC